MPGLAWLRRPSARRAKEDVCALQQRVQELQAAEIRYRELIDALPVMVYSVEPTPPYRAFFHTAARALDPFFTTKQARHGTGLGLSTVYGIAKHAGGGISIQSALGAGTTITVLLPRGSEALAAVEPPPAQPAASVDTPACARILVVDDEDGVRVTLGRMLARRGYDVVTASSGSEALRAWETAPGGFAVVVTDIRMPGMSGHELVQRFRAKKPELPIVLMSGYADDPLTIPGVSHGPVRFFSKPLRLQDVVASVGEVLAGR